MVSELEVRPPALTLVKSAVCFFVSGASVWNFGDAEWLDLRKEVKLQLQVRGRAE